MKIEILTSDPHHPINPYLKRLQSKLQPEHSVSIIQNPGQITSGDLLFLVSCTVLVPIEATMNFRHAMVIHASDLPKGRGWSPHIWELLNGADFITLSLLDAAAEIDCGDIYKKITVDVPRSALWDEINDLLFSSEIQLIEYAIQNFKNLEKLKQDTSTGVTRYPKRNPRDSEIDPEKSISEQFDLMRLCDPNRYPAWFHHRGQAYKITLEKFRND